MLSKESFVEIQVLHRQGMSIKEIARELGVSRNTVRKYLRLPCTYPSYQQRGARPSKLDSFKAYLDERMKSADPKRIPVPVLYQEIKEQGYQGKLRILNTYIAQAYPRNKVQEPLVRFETAPGQQMQVDFTTIRRGARALKAFVAILGYSRAAYVHFFTDERSESWITGLIGAFEYFGGVCREVLFDNAKCIVIERNVYGEGLHRWHPDLLGLSKQYGFKPKACKPYRAQTKGKVERFNRYLKDNYVMTLSSRLKSSQLELDVETANAQIGSWLHRTANARQHQTTGAVPSVLLEDERHEWIPLPCDHHLPASRHKGPHLPLPVESIQHPLSQYDAILWGACP
ncbi:MAG: IS21 family transposase [Proteobacteria bacterium]|nr:IS21 family transposase [Pseudomonadota bacterium]